MKNINLQQLNNEFSEKMESLPTKSDVHEQVKFYNETLTAVFDYAAPQISKKVQIRESFPWYNDELRECKRTCRKYERLWKNSGLTVHKLAFQEQCAIFNKLLYKSKRSHIQSSIGDNKNTKNLYKVVNQMLKSNISKKHPSIISSENLPNAFAKFFQAKIDKIHSQLDSQPDKKHFEDEVFDGIHFDQFALVSPTLACNLIQSLNSTTCKLDPLPTSILKKCSSGVSSAIANIINTSLKSSTVPSEFKKAIVCPLLKKQNLDVNTLSNYRPISHLSFLSKILEKVVATQLIDHLTINNLQDEYQSAYRPGFSTETALMKITDDILTALDKNISTALIMIDMSSAFDTIHHKILLNRLSKSFGLKNEVLEWFKSYLNERSQFICVNNILSDSVNLSSGVPQGSVLAPLLFTLYLKPLVNIIKSYGFKYHFYADDLQFYIMIDEYNISSVKDLITECLNTIENWLSVNKLKLNCNKTQCIVFSRKQSVSTSIFSDECNDNVLQPLASVKNLGVFLDKNLAMNDQISAVVKKCYFHIRNISKIRKYLTAETCKVLVNSLVLSQLDYCNALYYGLPNSSLLRLQRVQNTAARLVSCVKKSAHITPVLVDLHWLPIEYRLKFKILLHAFKVVNGHSPSYLSDLICKHVPTRALRSSDANLLVVPRTFSKFGDRKFSVCAPYLWNILPEHIKDAESVSQFKRLLKTHFFTKAYAG